MRTKILSAALLSLGLLASAGAAGAQYHGGPVIVSAKVVDIFWGPTFSNPASPDYAYAQSLIAFRNQFGTTREYNVITQYYQIVGGVQQFVQLSNLASGTADWLDPSTPPVKVTDTAVRNKIQTYLATHPFNNSTIYEVFLPSTLLLRRTARPPPAAARASPIVNIAASSPAAPRRSNTPCNPIRAAAAARSRAGRRRRTRSTWSRIPPARR